jgi:hypothetical protein
MFSVNDLLRLLGTGAVEIFNRGDLDGALRCLRQQESLARQISNESELLKALGDQALMTPGGYRHPCGSHRPPPPSRAREALVRKSRADGPAALGPEFRRPTPRRARKLVIPFHGYARPYEEESAGGQNMEFRNKVSRFDQETKILSNLF